MRILLILFLMFSLQGCFYQKADITDIKKSLQFCKSRGGIREILIYFDRGEVVYCLNGDREMIDTIKLKLYKENKN